MFKKGIIPWNRGVGSRRLQCKQCGVDFWAIASRKPSFCSNKCRFVGLSERLKVSYKNGRTKGMLGKVAWNRKEKKVLICKQCGLEFLVIPSKKNTKFCSSRCHYQSRKGMPPWNKGKTGIYSEETLKKLRERTPAWPKGKKRPPRTPEHAKKCGACHIGKHPGNWLGEDVKRRLKINRIRNSTKMVEWRTAIFKRDNWTCQACGARGGYLEAHHVKSFCDYPEFRFDIKNGTTLCKTCHRRTDNYGGRNRIKFTGLIHIITR